MDLAFLGKIKKKLEIEDMCGVRKVGEPESQLWTLTV